MELPDERPEWARETPGGVVLLVPRERGWAVLRAAASLGVGAGGLALVAGAFPVGLSLIVAGGAVLLAHEVLTRAVRVELEAERIGVDGRWVARVPGGIDASDPERILVLAGTDGDPLVLTRLRLGAGERRWLASALHAWSSGAAVPPLRHDPPPAEQVGRLEPGRQTIELPSRPLRPADVLVGVAVLAVAGVLTAAVLGNVEPPLDALAIVPWIAALAWFVRGLVRRRVRSLLEVRADALLISTGATRRTIAYADIVRVEAVRLLVHSELEVETCDGTIERFPVRGFPIAGTLEEAIRLAMSRSSREAEAPEVRRALDALREAR